MLRKIRLTSAGLFFVLITLLFLDFTGTIHAWFGWMARIQFLPALLALNLGIVLFLLVITLLFGRVYCSVICPMGVFQDVVSRIAGRRKKNRFRYSKPSNGIRYGVLGLFVLACLAGFGSLVALLAPYSSYGRIVSSLFTPVYQWVSNLFALLAERVDSYAFYSVEVWVKSLPTFVIATVTFVVIVILAWRGGRTYCNTVCPVGTVLGFIARYSWFKPVIDTSKCVNCNLCARNCKASCIDVENQKIDYSRCVACMNCIGKCHRGAIKYTRPSKSRVETNSPDEREEHVNNARRNFLTTTAMLATTSVLKAQEKKVDGGLAVIEDKKIPARATAITPPGSLGAANMARHCTACQLCVSVCSNGVLRPSTDLMKLMQPEMSYERGYCRPECTKCADVCPAGAIQMIPSNPGDAGSPQIPVVNEERCIGCGACENLCPARPFSAIYVEGHLMHKTV